MKEDFFKQLNAFIEVASNDQLIDLQAAITYKVRENKRKELVMLRDEQQERHCDDVRRAERAAEREETRKR